MITCEISTNSPAASLVPMQQLFNPMDIRDTTHLCNAAIDHEAALQSTNSQWNNISHSILGNDKLSIETKERGEFLIATKRNSDRWMLVAIQSRVLLLNVVSPLCRTPPSIYERRPLLGSNWTRNPGLSQVE